MRGIQSRPQPCTCPDHLFHFPWSAVNMYAICCSCPLTVDRTKHILENVRVLSDVCVRACVRVCMDISFTCVYFLFCFVSVSFVFCFCSPSVLFLFCLCSFSVFSSLSLLFRFSFYSISLLLLLCFSSVPVLFLFSVLFLLFSVLVLSF